MPVPPQIPVLNASGTPVNVNAPLAPGRAAAAESRPVALSTEDLAAINAIATALAGTLAVTGAFYPATQSVSGTITANAGTGTFAVSLASLPALATGANVIGGVTQSGTWNVGTVTTVTTVSTVTNLSQFGGAAINLGAGAVGTGTLRTTQASDSPLVAATGAIADAAWASGNGTLVAILKTIATAALDTTTASPVKIDQTTPGTTNAVSVQQPCDVINYVPTLDTAAYTAGDVLAATAAISNVMRVNDGRGLLVSLTGIDKSKQKPAMTILFYQTNVTSAAANAANALSDADQLNLLSFHRILAADWIDYANNSICGFKGPTSPGLLLEAASGTKDVYAVCILDAGTPTFAVGDLMFKLGVVQS